MCLTCFRLIRQAYLELALVYLYSSGGIQVKDGSYLESVTGDSGDESATSTKSSSVRDKKRSVSVVKFGS